MWDYYFNLFKRARWTDSWLLVKLTLLSIGMLFFLAGALYLFEEGLSFGDSLWTAYISLTTIGYGDIAAKTWQGRTATVASTFLGIGCLAIFAGAVIEKNFERRVRNMRGEGSFSGRDHVVIINVPSYDEVEELLNEMDACAEYSNRPRIVVSAALPGGDLEVPSSIMKRVDSFIRGTPSSMATLERANMKEATASVLLSSSAAANMDDVNILTAGIIEKTWPHIVTVIDCVRSDTLKSLPFFGIDGGVNSRGMQMGLLVQELKDPGTFKVYNQLSSNSHGEVIFISRQKLESWGIEENTLRFGDIKKAVITLDFPLTVLGVKKASEEVVLNIKNAYNIQLEDRLIYMSERRFDWRGHSAQILAAVGNC